MRLKDIINDGVNTITRMYPEKEAREMVFAYMEDTFGHKRYAHILDPDLSLSADEIEKAQGDFMRMAAGEPLQYVTGKAYFYGRTFHVTQDVLIPRQETEILCHEAISAGGGKILDLCTGSGCIAWTLALELPGAHVTAVDISDGALSIARTQNFQEQIGVQGVRVPDFIKADVLQGPGSFRREYDLIVSNPPYVMEAEKSRMRCNVLDHEPSLALFVPDSDPLLFYRAVALWAEQCLVEGGVGIVEINESLGNETAEIFRLAGFSDVCVLKDLHEKDRFVKFSR